MVDIINEREKYKGSHFEITFQNNDFDDNSPKTKKEKSNTHKGPYMNPTRAS